MTYRDGYGEYRLSLDLETQLFKVYLPDNPQICGYGTTIEKALQELSRQKEPVQMSDLELDSR